MSSKTKTATEISIMDIDKLRQDYKERRDLLEKIVEISTQAASVFEKQAEMAIKKIEALILQSGVAEAVESKDFKAREVHRIPEEYWDGERYSFFDYFDTFSSYWMKDVNGAEMCDLNLIQCKDGRWFIEDNWETANGAKDAFDPHDKNSSPTLFAHFDDAKRRAAEIIHSVTGRDIDELMSRPDD